MDARVRYTKKVIKETFFTLLKDKPLSKITVSEICEQAQINRATFYKHYDNQFDLLEKLETELLDSLQSSIEARKNRTIENAFEAVLVHLKTNYDAYQILFSENGDTTFMQRILSVCYNENMAIIKDIFPDLDETRQNWLFYFLAEGCNGMLKNWIEGGMKEDISLLVDFSSKIVTTLNRFLK